MRGFWENSQQEILQDNGGHERLQQALERGPLFVRCVLFRKSWDPAGRKQVVSEASSKSPYLHAERRNRVNDEQNPDDQANGEDNRPAKEQRILE